MECPICKNKMGFVYSTCIDCGYNHNDHTYHFIEVSTKILEQIVSPEMFEYLVKEHERSKKKIKG